MSATVLFVGIGLSTAPDAGAAPVIGTTITSLVSPDTAPGVRESLTFTARVAANSGPGRPTGRSCSSPTLIGAGAVDGTGAATGSLAAGLHMISVTYTGQPPADADYGGDPLFAASSSVSIDFAVTAVPSSGLAYTGPEQAAELSWVGLILLLLGSVTLVSWRRRALD
jgi:LPXTG-motif cell wall-anchored protein